MTTTVVDNSHTGAASDASRKLGLGALTAVVIGSMIGSGVFSLPQNMANGAGPLAIIIGWGISGIGILALAFIVVALASGAAGALAFTTGVSATLIGVMVAVALLPPLVTSGLLLGGGHPTPAMGALSLFLVNLICVNLAGVATFLVQGIQPTSWWEKDRAAKATRIAIGLWVALLGGLVGVVLLFLKGAGRGEML